MQKNFFKLYWKFIFIIKNLYFKIFEEWGFKEKYLEFFKSFIFL